MARRRGEAWRASRGVAGRHGVTCRGVSWRVVACRVVEGVKGVKVESAPPRGGGLDGFALLKGVDCVGISPPRLSWEREISPPNTGRLLPKLGKLLP